MTSESYQDHINKQTRKVSVIIPTYNDGELLQKAIISVSKSSYKLQEIIVIDDGSETKEAQLIVESLINKINIPLIYKRKDNGGPASARNLGIQNAKSKWISFLDSDDIMISDSIASKFDHFDRCKNKKKVAGVYGSFIWSSSNQSQPFSKSYKSIPRNHVGIIGKVPGGAPSYLFRKNALIEIGGFDESLIYNEDFDLLLRLIKSGYHLVGTDKPGFIRNIQENSLTRSSVFKALNGSKRFLKKAFQNELLDNYEIFKRMLVIYASTLKQIYIQFINKYF
tara:strand:+ start:548 stop:1390 length:843 start_codon:yes stop_codon:yes gene_type:complete